MKKRDIQELKNRPHEELERMLKESRERLRVLRFDLAAGKVKDIAELRGLRRDTARILTFLKLSHEKKS